MTSPAILAALFIAFTLSCLAPTNATAQQAPQAVLDFGVHSGSGLNLRLIFPAIANGKLYYFLDEDKNGVVSVGDRINHNTLDTLLNNGVNTTGTQEGNHDGTDDARSVFIGDHYTLVLPTSNELKVLITTGGVPSGWSTARHWAADGVGNNHRVVSPGIVSVVSDVNFYRTAFQVIARNPVRPAAPTGITARPEANSLVVSWTLVPDINNGGSPITSYFAGATHPSQPTRTCTTPGTATATQPNNTCTIRNLLGGVEYRVSIQAGNSVGLSDVIEDDTIRATPTILENLSLRIKVFLEGAQ